MSLIYFHTTIELINIIERLRIIIKNDIDLINIDDEGILIVEPQRILVDSFDDKKTTEAGGITQFGITLNVQPTSDINISLVYPLDFNIYPYVPSNDASEFNASSNNLLFTSNNWNIEQVITFTGVDDDEFDEDISQLITFHANDEAISDETVTITNLDDEGDIITYTLSKATTSEAGGTSTLSVILNTQPTDDVTISLSSTNENEGVISPTELIFTSSDWNTTQTATITGIEDNVIDFYGTYEIRASSSSSDARFTQKTTNDGTAYDIFLLANIEEGNLEIVIDEIVFNTLDTNESSIFNVYLSQEINTTVRFHLETNSTQNSQVSFPATKYLTFSSNNWNVPQTVQLNAVNIDNTTVNFRAQTRFDSLYNSINVYKSIKLANLNNDTQNETLTMDVSLIDDLNIITPAIQSIITDKTQGEDSTGLIIVINEDFGTQNDVQYSVTSSDENISRAYIQNENLIIEPIENRSGTVTIVITATLDGVSDTLSFTYTINAINDIPTLQNQLINLDKNTSYSFTKENFLQNFSDVENDLLQRIKLSSLPLEGILKFNDVNMSINDELLINDTDHMVYHAPLNFLGTDFFHVMAYDGYDWSNEANVSFEINTIIADGNIFVQEGWNLISANIEDITAISPQAIIVWKYKNAQWQAYLHDVTIQQELEALEYYVIDNLSNDEGFWILAAESFVLPINVNNSLNITSNINQGWSLLGSSQDESINNYSCQSGNTMAIWKYVNNTWKLYSTIPHNENYESFDTIFENEGYWSYCQ